MQLEVGAILEGKVTSITKFGAFVALPEGKTGMVHISEVAPTFVKEIRDHLKEGDAVRVKVIGIDAQGRINLSIKQLAENVPAPRPRTPRGPAPSSPRPDRFEWSSRKSESMSFEDMMNRFKQDSDEKISTLKKNVDSKRGSSYRKSGRY